MQNSPVALLVVIAVSLYVAKMWFDDFRSAQAGTPNARALPGAVPAAPGAVIIGCLGAWVLLAAETLGEIHLGLAEKQTTMTYLFAFYTLVAAVVEEIVFRGYIVVANRGRAVLWASIGAASLLFAVLHPYLWTWKDGQLLWHFDAKSTFSTAMIFAGSLWFYFLRFAAFNPSQSLLPCMAAHLAKNLGVIGIKAAQGFLIGAY